MAHYKNALQAIGPIISHAFQRSILELKRRFFSVYSNGVHFSTPLINKIERQGNPGARFCLTSKVVQVA
jgi:hypothetical protein